jgi:alginate O-acetyltransferase complex protein AlgI
MFKYADWTIGNIDAALASLGVSRRIEPLAWVLPLGISFYIFEAISYVIECMRGKEQRHPHRDFQLFFAFFPHLVAGPVMRAKELIPQFDSTRWQVTAKQLGEGVWLITSGLFLKNILADRLAGQVDSAFVLGVDSFSAGDALCVAVGFALQIYLDFSAYSRLAIGSAKFFGIELVDNFNYPFAAKTPGDFWNRWHISLSRWIRDYLFFPIAGKRMKLQPMMKAALISMTICGLWHGAGWNFIVWGFYHGLVLAVYYLGRATLRPPAGAPPTAEGHWLDRRGGVLFSSALTFIALLPSWILFRAPNLSDAGRALASMITPWRMRPRVLSLDMYGLVAALMLTVWLAPIVHARLESWLASQTARAAMLRGAFTAVLLILALAVYHSNQTFIYFQF